jgi:small subunit ribosomal protein S3
MGQKINPIGFRLGVVRGWDSNWFDGKNMASKLIEDEKIRNYINARISKGGISKIIIERTLKRITLTIQTARPGVVIGKAGAEVDKLKEELKKLTGKEVQINIFEIKRPELDAKLVADTIAQQIEGRISYRRAMKQAIQGTMRVGAQGIKVKISGRLAGAEMARNEMYKEGRIPLHTLRADIDYALSEALTVYGLIGIKVWICKGEIFGKRDLSPNVGLVTTDAQNNNNNSGDNRGKKVEGRRKKK